MEIPLIWTAVLSNDFSLVKTALETADIDTRSNNDSLTPLMVSANHSKADMVNFLISNGANVNATSDSGMTPLMYAMNPNSEHTQAVVTALIEAGADINTKSTGGNTALMEASHKGMLRQVMTLILAGANLNVQNSFGETALIVASMKGGEPGVIKALLIAGIDRTLKDVDGKTALDIANEHGEEQIIAELLLQTTS
jgi:serine/threonine-protein phosphatase 6 regulatory ankyrin repeat subunit B